MGQRSRQRLPGLRFWRCQGAQISMHLFEPALDGTNYRQPVRRAYSDKCVSPQTRVCPWAFDAVHKFPHHCALLDRPYSEQWRRYMPAQARGHKSPLIVVVCSLTWPSRARSAVTRSASRAIRQVCSLLNSLSPVPATNLARASQPRHSSPRFSRGAHAHAIMSSVEHRPKAR